MNTERKPSITELIEALELHLSPHTDPDHCDPCIYNPTNTENLEVPQTTCQYRLMRDCLEALKHQRTVIILLANSNITSAKEFVDYYIETQYKIPDNEYLIETQYKIPDNEYLLAKFAFSLGNAFADWKKIKEEENGQC